MHGSFAPGELSGWDLFYMPSILSGLEIAKQSLTAQQFALSVTQKNVANASNEHYTRQDAVWSDVSVTGGFPVSIQAVRDKYLDFSISQELQSLGKHQTTAGALQKIDAIFNENSGQGLQKALSDFFNSFSALSVNPESLTLRQQVLSKATALTTEFHRLYNSMQRVESSINDSVKSTVDEINAIVSKIAGMNKNIGVAAGTDAEYSLRDERQKLLEDLSSLMDITYYEADNVSVVVSTPQGNLLVIGSDSFPMETSLMPDSDHQGVRLNGMDITDSVQAGKLGGLIETRNLIAGYLGTLDDMAAIIASRINEQHAEGVDLDGALGGDLLAFSVSGSGANAGAARSIEVALSDPRKIAAANPALGSGNNENANLLSGIKDERLFSSSETIGQFYESLIYRIGSDAQTADSEETLQTYVIEQLKNQRSALSGVSLDEEAVNLIKFQKAYQASARIVSVLDSLSNAILNMVGV